MCKSINRFLRLKELSAINPGSSKKARRTRKVRPPVKAGCHHGKTENNKRAKRKEEHEKHRRKMRRVWSETGKQKREKEVLVRDGFVCEAYRPP